jgi:hypothetical protein
MGRRGSAPLNPDCPNRVFTSRATPHGWLTDRAIRRFSSALPINDQHTRVGVIRLRQVVKRYVNVLNQLDAWLTKAAEAPGIQIPPRADLRATLDRVAQQCRGSLQNDVLDLVNLNNQASVLLRVKAMQEITEKYMETGQRYRRRVPQ